MTQNEKPQTEAINPPEQGRSMIEMLGTLAIMGVLSIGGIAGYSYAVTKYKANETIDELNNRAIVYATQLRDGGQPSGTALRNGEFGDKTTLGYGVSATVSEYENEFNVTLSEVPFEVCEQILKNYTIPAEISVNGRIYSDVDENIDICGAGNTDMVFAFNGDLSNDWEMVEVSGGPNNGETTEAIMTDSAVATTVSGCECVINADCGKNSGKYCHFENVSCETPICGVCKPVIKDEQKVVAGVGTYIIKKTDMSWWNAKNYCEALGNGARMALLEDFGGRDPIYMSAFKTAFDGGGYWFYDSYDQCQAYFVYLQASFIGGDVLTIGNRPLCYIGEVSDNNEVSVTSNYGYNETQTPTVTETGTETASQEVTISVDCSTYYYNNDVQQAYEYCNSKSGPVLLSEVGCELSGEEDTGTQCDAFDIIVKNYSSYTYYVVGTDYYKGHQYTGCMTKYGIRPDDSNSDKGFVHLGYGSTPLCWDDYRAMLAEVTQGGSSE